MEHELDDLIVSELDKLYRFAYNQVHDEYKAEDIVQDTILTAYKAFPRLKDKNKITPWLWGIARNTVMRSFKHKNEISMEYSAIIDVAGISFETPEDEYLRKEDMARVRKAVSYLAKNYRDVCVMYYLENKDYNTIARELGIPLSSVKWRLNQTKSQLREELEKMDYMENGYRKAVQLHLNMGGWVGHWDPELGNYDNADKALEGLLPQNICVSAYERAKTVTEISSDLGVAADYVEEALKKLVSTQCVKQIANRYQTQFPIWDKKANDDVFGENWRISRACAKEVVDKIYSLEGEIRKVGFYGCDKSMDKLILFLIGFVSDATENNKFETEKLPFTGNDKAWYILGTTEKKFFDYGNSGINSNGSKIQLREYYFSQKYTKDNRSNRTEEQETFYSLYLGQEVCDKYSLSKLLESGKVIKSEESYKITVPVLSMEKGEWDGLKKALAPVLKITNSLQATLYTRSCEAVKKYIPKHISEQSDFFGSYCSLSILENVLFEELVSRNTEITQDMATWFKVK